MLMLRGTLGSGKIHTHTHLNHGVMQPLLPRHQPMDMQQMMMMMQREQAEEQARSMMMQERMMMPRMQQFPRLQQQPHLEQQVTTSERRLLEYLLLKQQRDALNANGGQNFPRNP